MCLYTTERLNRKYTATKKNKGIIPEMKDLRTKFYNQPCGKCVECKKKLASEWSQRLKEEMKHDKTAKFVTLTFDDESMVSLQERINKRAVIEEDKRLKSGEPLKKKLSGYNLDNEIATKCVRLFLERWRKKTKKSVRHWLITELGGNGTENIHLHGILWTEKSSSFIRETWKYGFIWDSVEKDGYVNEKTVNYITKYCTKIDEKHQYYVPKVLCSKGLGASYFDRRDWKNNKFNGDNTKQAYIAPNGAKISLPIYYRNRIYSDRQKESLWINMLDKNVRFVDGMKIDVSTKVGEDNYYRMLDAARKKNRRLGYGDDKKDWSKIKYERERRKINHQKRMKQI